MHGTGQRGCGTKSNPLLLQQHPSLQVRHPGGIPLLRPHEESQLEAQTSWVQAQALPNLVKSFNLSSSWFPHLQSGQITVMT